MKRKIRHIFFYKIAHIFAKIKLAHKYKFSYDRINVKYSPYIVIANHVMKWDPLFITLSFWKQMYFVASDHLFRMGFRSFLLKFGLAPIARTRTAQETQTVISIFRRLREKNNVCIYAEGTTSFDGQTGEIPLSTGKLIKRAGVALVTYKFTGGFLSYPRWGRYPRKGRMEGRLVQIYSPEQIASMSEDEIYQVIKKDIYTNAYDEQNENLISFRGRKPAERLELALYCCPNCKQFTTLSSCKDILSCVCGFKVRLNEFGFFEYPESKEPPPYKTTCDWIKWEREELKRFTAAHAAKDIDNNIPIFTDDNQRLIKTARASHNIPIAKGKLCFFYDRLSVGTTEIRLDEIVEMDVISMKTIVFATKDNVFEIRGRHPRSAMKYMDIFKIIKANK